MRIAFAGEVPSPADLTVVGIWQDRRPTPSFTALDADTALSRALAASPRFAGKEGEILDLFTATGRVAVIGLGPEATMDAARAERLGGALYGALAGSGARTMAVRLDLAEPLPAHVGLGLSLRAWHPPLLLRSRLADDETPTLTDAVIMGDAAAWPPLAILAESIRGARDLVVEPGNRLTPQTFAAQARLLQAEGCTVEVLEPAAQGLNLLAAVGQGSIHPPCLVVARWNGGKAKEAPLVFVGKGITFDTGGLSIKPASKMEEMKGDMAGAAVVLMALRSLAAARAPLNAAAVLAIAENMPAAGALRPGDVIRAHAGITVEVVDTDAEGRLVLADALSWACASLKPRAVVDLATLTGAMVTTLGRHHAGLFANDDALADRLLQAGRAVGEPVWRLPLSEQHDEALKSPLADLRNCAWGRVPDALHAARFLQHFVPDGIPWAHLDIAGVADAEEDGPLGRKGPTGWGVRLLVALAQG